LHEAPFSFLVKLVPRTALRGVGSLTKPLPSSSNKTLSIILWKFLWCNIILCKFFWWCFLWCKWLSNIRCITTSEREKDHIIRILYAKTHKLENTYINFYDKKFQSI
jgi:hypothetical protein